MWLKYFALQVHRRICIAAMAASSSSGELKKTDGHGKFRLTQGGGPKKLVTLKMSMCKFHKMGPGNCQREQCCRYAHSEEEIGQEVVDWQMKGCKVTICKHWQNGRCWNSAEACDYGHGQERQFHLAKYEKQKGVMQCSNTFWASNKKGHQDQRVPPPPPAKHSAELVINMDTPSL